MDREKLVLEHERLDDLQNGYMLIQNPKQFCFGIDAVLLSWFANVKPQEQVLDMGTGTGIVPILLKARYPKGKYTGLEIQEESADVARRSVAYNHLEEDIVITTGDIMEDVISQAAKVLKPRGRFYMVHRPFRLAEIMRVMVKYRIEPKRMRLVHPYVDKEPNMVLIEGMRGGNSRMTVEKPLIVYEKPGVYTREILDIYGQETKK